MVAVLRTGGRLLLRNDDVGVHQYLGGQMGKDDESALINPNPPLTASSTPADEDPMHACDESDARSSS